MGTVTSVVPSSLTQMRRVSAATGVLALVVLGFLPEGASADRVAFLALAALGLATTSGCIELLIPVRLPPTTFTGVRRSDLIKWVWAAIGVTLVVVLAVQTWFRPGTTVASGDISLPDGTAWLTRIFDPWIWSGSNLGEPSQLPYALPWAGVLGLVHALGGNPELAQRIWYTALFVAAGLSVLGLIASLRMGPAAGVIATAVYLLNPYIASEINYNPIFIAALCPLAAIPAVLIAASSGVLSLRWSTALIALQAPLIGYIFSDPPLVGLILGAVLATPLLVAWIDGRRAAWRCVLALQLSMPLLLAASAYWIVPAVLHLSGFESGQLASVSSWSWTEGRATIRNAFWLNNTWGWSHQEYFPYAMTFDALPFSAAKFVLPAMAFAALALGPVANRQGNSQQLAFDLGPNEGGHHKPHELGRQLRIAIAFAAAALFTILLSTGTNQPGSIVFNPLYNLPFGWLLREPGRFLMLDALAYAVLIAITLQALADRRATTTFNRWRFPRLSLLYRPADSLALVTIAVIGFPIYTGAVVPDSRPSLPSAHVKMPGYWPEMASYVDSLALEGGVLVMPPDDFYQMPYSWGYYGTDNFIVDLFHRPVLVPNGQGYIATSAQLEGAINLTAQSILQGDWRQTEALITALNTPLILVRRDISTADASRSIVPPSRLSLSLKTAPNFDFIRELGSLDLFVLNKPMRSWGVGAKYVTVDSAAPDLRLLSAFPPGTALVSSNPQTGVTRADVSPPLDQWQETGGNLVWQPNAPPGWTYRIEDLGSRTVIALENSGTFALGPSKASIRYEPDLAPNAVTITIRGRIDIADGDFASRLWSPIRDCNPVLPVQAKPLMSAQILANAAPGGNPALQLSTSFDSACVARSIEWHGGPALLTIMAHHLQGSFPRLCVWETGPDRCISIPPIPETTGWSTYRASVIPDTGTSSLTLFLYADVAKDGARTVDEYSNVRLIELPTLPNLALLADPPSQLQPSTELMVSPNTFSNQWQGSIGAHVLVDGMTNGWLIPTGYAGFVASYRPAATFQAAQALSILAVVATLLFSAGWVLARRIFGRRIRKLNPYS